MKAAVAGWWVLSASHNYNSSSSSGKDAQLKGILLLFTAHRLASKTKLQSRKEPRPALVWLDQFSTLSTDARTHLAHGTSMEQRCSNYSSDANQIVVQQLIP